MNVKITPHTLYGNLNIPASKSIAHRLLICAALAKGTSVINDVTFSKDIYATINALKSMGATISYNNSTVTVTGIEQANQYSDIDCCESGSTLRFLIPVAAALGINSTFIGEGRLPERPIDIYVREFSQKNIVFDYKNTMPFQMKGQLKNGEYVIEGNISSQFITGLLFSLPILNGDSKIVVKGKLESKPYADMTIICLNKFGINIEETDYGYFIKGSQKYISTSSSVEGDYSQAAFFLVANALGSDVTITNTIPNSIQGDKKIIEIIDLLCYNINALSIITIDATDIPDLVPIISVLSSFAKKEVHIVGAERLKIKESDRLESTASMINNIGGNVIQTPTGLIIKPVSNFIGGVVDSYNDHRIVMAASIAATVSKGEVIIKNAQAVEKSYPLFFEEFNRLGGISHVIDLES